jgi:signal recognition particle receptor subunit beta
MPVFNYARKEVTVRIVYFGPASSGKSTNLTWIHEHLKAEGAGELLISAIGDERLLSVDFLPAGLPAIRGMTMRVKLCTASGQIRANETWRTLLEGVDGIVFVADSESNVMDANSGARARLLEDLLANHLDPDAISLVMQLNKRDSPRAASVTELNRVLNPREARFFETSALTGRGVEETLRATIETVHDLLTNPPPGSWGPENVFVSPPRLKPAKR